MWTNNSGGVGRTGKRENPSVSSVLSKPKIAAGSADLPGYTIIELAELGSGNCGIERNREGAHMDLKTLLDTPPWDWPGDAGRTFWRILTDPRSKRIRPPGCRRTGGRFYGHQRRIGRYVSDDRK